VTGVHHTNNTVSCDDATVCNGHEVCGGGTCNPGTPPNCDDGNICTTDSCDPATGCVHTSDQTVPVTTCGINPTTLNVKATADPFTIDTRIVNSCNGNPLNAASMGAAWISQVGSPTIGTIVLPTPSSAPGCDSFTQDGIWETRAARTVTGNGSAKLRFTTPSDGNCQTEDGDRQDIIALLLDVPDGATATICYEALYPGALAPVSCCAPVRVNNRGVR